MSGSARLELDGNVYELDTFVGSEGELAIDIRSCAHRPG